MKRSRGESSAESRETVVRISGDEIAAAIKKGIAAGLAEHDDRKRRADARVGAVLVDQETGRKYIVTDLEWTSYSNGFGSTVRVGVESMTVKPV